MIPNKTAQIQIRVTPAQKRELVRRARSAGLDLSAWMLERLIPSRQAAFEKLVTDLSRADAKTVSYVLAALGDFLSGLAHGDLASAVGTLPLARLDPLIANQLAAMVETASNRVGVRPPAWTEEIPPLETPWFSSALASLRMHLLCNSPPAYRRRNLFVDSTFEARV